LPPRRTPHRRGRALSSPAGELGDRSPEPRPERDPGEDRDHDQVGPPRTAGRPRVPAGVQQVVQLRLIAGPRSADKERRPSPFPPLPPIRAIRDLPPPP